jgi:hypothetical protein
VEGIEESGRFLKSGVKFLLLWAGGGEASAAQMSKALGYSL